jgi:hypothetical protein
MPVSRRIGLGLLMSTTLMWSGWTLWSHTRTWCPVNVPLSLAAGDLTTTREFAVNVAGPYKIEVEAKGTSTMPLPEVVCSLGLDPMRRQKTCSTKSVLRASWTLTSHGKKIAEGSSDSETGGWTAEGWSQASRTIGTFDARKGQTFKLSVQTLQDASSLSAASPRMKVVAGGTNFESVLVFSGVLNIACIGLGALSIMLLLVPLRMPRMSKFRIN